MTATSLSSSVFPFAFALALIFALTALGVRAQPVRFQDIDQIMDRFDQTRPYRKKALTLGRLPASHEIGTLFPTWVADGNGGVIQETTNRVAEDHIVVRKPEPVIPGIYNEWLVKRVEWLEIYGALPTGHEFSSFNRKAAIEAILIDDEVLQLLGSEDGETAMIHVDWNPEGMRVFRSGYLTRKGYGIAPEEMEATYEQVDSPLKR